MRIHHALAQRPFDVESEAQVGGAPLVCLFCAADVAIAGPARPRCFAECCNLGAIAEQLLAPGILPYHVCGVVEVCGFGVGAEDVAEEEVRHAALDVSVSRQWHVVRTSSYRSDDANGDDDQVEGLLRGPDDFLAGRERIPVHASRVAGQGDGLARRHGGGTAGEAGCGLRMAGGGEGCAWAPCRRGGLDSGQQERRSQERDGFGGLVQSGHCGGGGVGVCARGDVQSAGAGAEVERCRAGCDRGTCKGRRRCGTLGRTAHAVPALDHHRPRRPSSPPSLVSVSGLWVRPGEEFAAWLPTRRAASRAICQTS